MKKVYIVLTHMLPPPGTAIHAHRDEGYRLERCEIVTRITNRQTEEATFIVDAVNKKIVKSRNKATNYDSIYDYFQRRYPDHNAELLKLLDNKE